MILIENNDLKKHPFHSCALNACCTLKLQQLKEVNLAWKWIVIICFVGWQVLSTIDAPFYIYWFASIIGSSGTMWMKIRESHIRLSFLAIYLLFSFKAYCILAPYELPPGGKYRTDWNGFNPNCTFYRVKDPNLEYEEDILVLNEYMNRDWAPFDESCASVFEPVHVWNMTVYDSHTLKFGFMTQYWNNPEMTSDFVCLVESDAVVDKEYFVTEFLKSGADISFTQHFWSHHRFEFYNSAVFCSVKTQSTYNRIWASAMHYYAERKYRRLFPPMDFLAGYAQNLYIFGWDEHGGCTKYHPHCKYIHFAAPKQESIDDMMEVLNLRDGENEE